MQKSESAAAATTINIADSVQNNAMNEQEHRTSKENVRPILKRSMKFSREAIILPMRINRLQ